MRVDPCRVAAASAALALGACVQSTGGQLVTFDVAAAGPVDANGDPRAFDTPLGWHVVLSKAKLHVGAVYLSVTVPTSGAQFTNCILPGVYTAEELDGLDVDVLSPTPQRFPAPATGTDDEARTAEVWLTGGDVNADTDATHIAEVEGVATKDAATIPFSGVVTIGRNRLIPSSDPAQPGLHPICKQRIVSPIQIDLRPADDKTLLVRVDPARWFSNVDFTGVPQASASPLAYVFPDDNSIAASQNLFSGLRATGTYQLSLQ